MKLSEIGELPLIETICKRFVKRSKDILVGIGDDAAVIKYHNKNLLMTTDMMVEGIHFDLSFMTPYQLGFKLVSVNVSDIYAMGGAPEYLLLNIAMNKNTEHSFMLAFFDGVHDAIKLYGVSLIGGDLSSTNNEMFIAASLTGNIDRPVKRSGAHPGDKIYVTGNLGDSACGLEILKKAVSCKLSAVDKKLTANSYPLKAKFSKSGLTWNTVKPLLKRHLMPIARNPKKFTKDATAMIDISDGLFIDLSRLCNESRVGAKLYATHIPISRQMQKVSSVLKIDPFKLAVSGGEDYELLFTASRNSKPETRNPKLKITCIGEITKKERTVIDKRGRESDLRAEGYQHFGVKR